jgi:hypothetical protein
VRFQASEVFLASHEALFSAPDSSAEMKGVIVDFSDSGTRPRAFAVVELADGPTIVVPVEKLTVIAPGTAEDEHS